MIGRVEDVAQTMMEMQREMMKTGMIEEGINDAMEGMDAGEISDADVEAEVEKLVAGLMVEDTGGMQVGATGLPQQGTGVAVPQEPVAEDDDVEARLAALRTE